MKLHNILILLSMTIMVAGCGGEETWNSVAAASDSSTPGTPTAVAQDLKESTPVDPAIVAADNGLGLKLLNSLLSESNGENIAISPLSISLAVQVLYNGAGGATQTEMAQALELGSLNLQTLNNDNAALQASLTNPDPSVQLVIANSLWTGDSVLAAFINIDKTYYGAMVGDSAGAPANVNAWVSVVTQGLITDLLPPDNYKGDTIIANALYFKGQWTNPFDPVLTIAGPFTLSNGSQTSATLMRQEGRLAYATGTLYGSHYQALQLPYGSGRLNMLFILPDASSDITSFISNLTPQDLASVTTRLTSTFLNIAVPRFTATYASSLKPALQSLGMKSAFLKYADFSAIARGLMVKDIFHQTFVEVDEAGTTAAAATGDVNRTVGLSPSLILNHPFLYAIEDKQTGELLFVGVLMNPN